MNPCCLLVLGVFGSFLSMLNIAFFSPSSSHCFSHLLFSFSASSMIVQDPTGNVLVATRANSWMGSNSSAVTYDGVYNGESYDARLEQPGWSSPGFQPGSDWAPCGSFSGCYNPSLMARSFPPITVQSVRKPVSITPLDLCPAGESGNENH